MNSRVNGPSADVPRVGFQLSQIGADAARRFAALVRPLGVTAPEAGVLRVLARTPGISQRELALRLGTGPSRVVALLDGLEASGLVLRERDGADRRTQRLRLTDSGRATMQGLSAAAERLSADLTKPLDDEERRTLANLLGKLASGLGLDPDEHAGHRDHHADRRP